MMLTHAASLVVTRPLKINSIKIYNKIQNVSINYCAIFFATSSFGAVTKAIECTPGIAVEDEAILSKLRGIKTCLIMCWGIRKTPEATINN